MTNCDYHLAPSCSALNHAPQQLELNYNGAHRHLCLVPDFTGDAVSFALLKQYWILVRSISSQTFLKDPLNILKYTLIII